MGRKRYTPDQIIGKLREAEVALAQREHRLQEPMGLPGRYDASHAASLLADVLHEFLWFIRKNPRIMRFLYGKHGPGEANRGGKVCN